MLPDGKTQKYPTAFYTQQICTNLRPVKCFSGMQTYIQSVNQRFDTNITEGKVDEERDGEGI